jgi:hypothetical protein
LTNDMLLPFDLPAVRRKKLTWILMAGGSPNRHFELAAFVPPTARVAAAA